MDQDFDDLDEYETFEPEPKSSRLDEERVLRGLERAIREQKRLRKRLIRTRQRERRSMGPGRSGSRGA